MEKATRGFKKKTIVGATEFKMKAWIKTIKDASLQKKVSDDFIVTGGAIASMLLGELPNDYDVYMRTKDTAKALAEYYLQDVKPSTNLNCKTVVEDTTDGRGVKIYIKSAGVAGYGTDLSDYRYFECLPPGEADKYLRRHIKKPKADYQLALASSNALSLTGDVQVVLRFCGPPEEIHKNYDFAHATNYYSRASGLVLNQEALECTLARELKYVGSLYPVCSMFRTKKFIERGWTITAGEMLKIAWDINKLDLNSIAVLQEQLIGMDSAYFHQVLHLLKVPDNGEIDRTYLFELINRVFDDANPLRDQDDDNDGPDNQDNQVEG